jgi:Major Facilitator Superfamily
LIDVRRHVAPGYTSIIASRGVTLFAERALEFLLPVVIYLKTGQVTLSGLALAIEWSPRVLSLPVTGALVDSFAVRRQLLCIDLVRVAAAVSLPLLGSVYALMVAGGLLSLCNGYAMLLGETALARVVAGPAMPGAQAQMQIAAQLSQTIGPVLAGLALPRIGFAPSCLALGALMLTGAVSTATATAALPALRAAGTWVSLSTVPSNLLAGLRAVTGKPALVRLILLTAFVNLVAGLALASLPALVTDRFGGSATAVGTVLGVASLASVVCAVAATYLVRRVRLTHIAGTAGICLAGSAYWMAGARSLLGFAAAFAVWSAAVTVFVIWMRTRRLHLLGRESVGSGLGVFVAAILFATPLSGAILAVFGGVFTPQQILFALAVVATAGAAILLALDLRAGRRVRQEVR